MGMHAGVRVVDDMSEAKGGGMRVNRGLCESVF